MKYQTIITVNNIVENLKLTDCLILDCRGGVFFDIKKHEEYLESHIPTAFYFCSSTESLNSYDKDSSNTFITGNNKTHLIDTVEEHGFDTESQIIIYDDDASSSFSNSVWLFLRAIGYKNVAVLQGGFTSWINQEMPNNKLNTKTVKSVNLDLSNNSYIH